MEPIFLGGILANTKSAKKFIIKSKKNRNRNLSNRSMLKTFIKKVNIAINKRNISEALFAFKNMQKCIDRQSIKGLIHKNKAARCKSKIFRRINLLIN